MKVIVDLEEKLHWSNGKRMLDGSGFKRELEKRSWDSEDRQLSSIFAAKRNEETV